jgi:hypothetical protein
MSNKLMPVLAAAAALALMSQTPAAAAATATPGRDACFASSSWSGWTASQAGDALYLRVGLRDVYRVQLSPGAAARKNAGEFLVSQVRGSNWICSPLDLDLAISDDHGFRRPLIATGLRKLSAPEVAALTPRERP